MSSHGSKNLHLNYPRMNIHDLLNAVQDDLVAETGTSNPTKRPGPSSTAIPILLAVDGSFDVAFPSPESMLDDCRSSVGSPILSRDSASVLLAMHHTKTLPTSPRPQPSQSTPLTCQTSIPSPTSNHSAPSSPTGSKRFLCTEPGCEKSFTRRYNLSAHLRCHRSEKPFVCSAPGCTLAFARKHDLSRHFKSLHEHKRSYGPCPFCDGYFTRSDALSRHLKVEAERRAHQ
ncbi:hypothetical protein HDU91_003940 [Kappamyces sp. JEL0680]|nr:hypothetical protein HDU91_003940 [Kappamyces sp. JEL0680]